MRSAKKQVYTKKPMSEGQRKFIFGLARRLDLDNEELHDVVEQKTGKASIKELTSYQAKLVTDHMQMLLGEEPKTPPDRPTDAQMRKIYALVRELGWLDNPKRLRGFLEKRYKVSDVRFLTDKNTNNLIEALKKIIAGGRAEREGYGELD